MNLSDFIGKRMLEMQFGKMITGWIQYMLFLPIYAKQYDLNAWQCILFAIVGFILTWLLGCISRILGLIRGYKKAELKGVQVDVKK